MKQHIILLAGISDHTADDVTLALRRRTVPHGHEVIVIGIPGERPCLLGVVVVSDDSRTAVHNEEAQFVGLDMVMG